MDATGLRTRHTTMSGRKLAQEGGDVYAQTWIGLPVVFTTYEGERLVGTLTHFDKCGYPCVTFDGGPKWARLDYRIEIVCE